MFILYPILFYIYKGLKECGRLQSNDTGSLNFSFNVLLHINATKKVMILGRLFEFRYT